MQRPDASTGERIAKLLARAGVASRREVERMIAEGRVARDGVPVATPATVLPSLAGVTVDGAPVAAAEPARLFLYHKPTGLLVTAHDPRGRLTIYDRLPPDLPRVVPVGRLDLATEGLLLLTTDGGLKRQLELPATGVARTYRARAYGQVSQAQLEALIEGVEVDGIRYGSIDANLERRTGANVWIELTLTEGKNREVRRVLEHLGLRVGRLIRTRYGPFVLGDLPAGAVGEVRAADLEAFRRDLGRGRSAAAERVPVQPPATPFPGERRGPVAMHPRAAPNPGNTGKQRTDAPPPRQRNNASLLDPGLRRGGAVSKPKLPTTPKSATKPKPATSRQAESTAPDADPRAAKPKRKPGWARPKPKPGPRKPRA